MTRSSVISSKGQVTVPQEIRNRLGLKEGDRVEFVVESGRTIIRRARSEENSFEAYEGVLKGAFPSGVPQINAWVDQMRSEHSPHKERRRPSRGDRRAR